MKSKFLFLSILCVGLGLRAIFLTTSLRHLELCSDEALLGLMARHVCLGEFHLMFWTQPHGGTLETYLVAPLYLVFGLKPIIVRIWPFIYSGIYLTFIYLLTRQFFGKKPALIALTLTAIPPVYLSLLSSLGVPMYGPPLLGCIIIIYLTHRIVSGERRLLLSAALGFIGGITFWVHQIVIAGLITCFVFLFLYDKRIFFKKYFWTIAVWFLIGSFPLWIYNIGHNFDTFMLARGADLGTSITNLKTALIFTMPSAWGFYLPTYVDNPYFINIPKVFFLLLAATYISLLLISIWVKPMKNKVHGKAILWFFFIIIIIIFSRTQRSNWWSTRYMIQTHAALIPLIALGLYWLSTKNKVIFTVLFSVILAINLYGNIRVLYAWQDPLVLTERLDLPSYRPLIEFLEKEDIRYGYMYYSFSYPAVFNANEEIILSPAYDERFGKYPQPYLAQVSKAREVAYIFHNRIGINPGTFQKSLERAGIKYKTKEIYPFTIFYRFVPLTGLDSFQEIPSSEWKITSNYNPSGVSMAVDRNLETRWGTAHPQTPDMYFMVDMGKVYTLGKAVLYFGRYKHDFPRGLNIYASIDGKEWEKVYDNPEAGGSIFWEKDQPRFFINQDHLSCVIEPIEARYIKLVQTGSHPRLDWSIVELYVYQKN